MFPHKQAKVLTPFEFALLFQFDGFDSELPYYYPENLVKKLKPLLPFLILPNQTAFVKDRLIVENTILASELVYGYHKNKGPKRITIKVDITKAFDTLSWEFLFNYLHGLCVPDQMIRWLKACVCTSTYTIGYNGSV